MIISWSLNIFFIPDLYKWLQFTLILMIVTQSCVRFACKICFSAVAFWHSTELYTRGASAYSYGFMTLKKQWGTIINLHLGSVVQPEAPAETIKLFRLSPKLAINILLVHLTLTSTPQSLCWGQRGIHGGPVCLSLPWPWHVLCPWVSLGRRH